MQSEKGGADLKESDLRQDGGEVIYPLSLKFLKENNKTVKIFPALFIFMNSFLIFNIFSPFVKWRKKRKEEQKKKQEQAQLLKTLEELKEKAKKKNL